MASSSEDQQSQSKATDPPPPHPSSAGNNPPPVYPPPTLGYPPPHGHGYSPAMGYPPPPPPGYPPAPGNYPPYNTYYAQAPPAAYYNNPQNYRAQTVSAGFLRGIVTALILLVAVMTLSSIITWIVLRPQIPVFKVDSFSVSNFNISKLNYSGNWNGSLTVENPNHKLTVNIERIQSFVNYKENTLAMSYADPFFIDVEKSSQMRVKLTSSSPDDPGNWLETEEKVGQEKASGTVSFNLRFFAWTAFRSGSWWTRRIVMKVFCEDLKLAFTGPAATHGVYLADAHSKTCSVLF
uniref:Late embryogenesis abundant protein LEA-2 subgroup domain-containing protein n=2 Tax=Cucumis sativus TaxID=3659 RepID=A0A0A0LGS8_CUCSA